MPTDYDNQLLREGLLRYKAGEKDLARRYFERAADAADDSTTRAAANYHLSLLSDDPAQKRHYLEEALAADPVHPEARLALAILDGRLKPEDVIDPDALPAPLAGEQQGTDRFTCPKCGGRMVYAPDGTALTCEFCARSQPLGGELAGEQDFFIAMASARGHTAAVETHILHCQGCGAEFLLGAGELSTACAWCGSNHVLRQSRSLPLPDAILPFGFQQEQAHAYLQAWAAKKAPRIADRLPALRPLYLPVYTFDIIGNIPWSGKIERNNYYVQVSGEHPIHLNDLLVPATLKHTRLFTALLQGLNFSITAPFDPRYLAGWSAEVPAMSLAAAALEARRQVTGRLHQEIRRDHGNLQDLRYQTTGIAVDAYRLVLVPVWLTEIPLSPNPAVLLVDGVTGAVHGKLPAPPLPAWLQKILGG